MGDIEESYGAEGAYQEDDVEPAVVEVELELAQHFRHDGSERARGEAQNHTNCGLHCIAETA